MRVSKGWGGCSACHPLPPRDLQRAPTCRRRVWLEWGDVPPPGGPGEEGEAIFRPLAESPFRQSAPVLRKGRLVASAANRRLVPKAALSSFCRASLSQSLSPSSVTRRPSSFQPPAKETWHCRSRKHARIPHNRSPPPARKWTGVRGWRCKRGPGSAGRARDWSGNDLPRESLRRSCRRSSCCFLALRRRTLWRSFSACAQSVPPGFGAAAAAAAASSARVRVVDWGEGEERFSLPHDTRARAFTHKPSEREKLDRKKRGGCIGDEVMDSALKYGRWLPLLPCLTGWRKARRRG